MQIAMINLEKMIASSEMNLLLQIAGYYLVWAFLFILVFSIYAKALYFSAKFSRPIKIGISFALFLLFSCIFVSPLIAGLAFNENWRSIVNSNKMFAVFFLGGYLASILPGAIYFKKKHLKHLKILGYFKG